MNDDEKLAKRICFNCHISLLYPHPELYGWLKCPTCGFCRKEKDGN